MEPPAGAPQAWKRAPTQAGRPRIRGPLTGLLSAPPHDYRDRAAAKQMASADTPEGGPSHGYCQGLPGAGRPGRRLFTDSNGLSRLTDS